MGKKKLFTCIVAIALLCAAGIQASFADTGPVPAGTVTILESRDTIIHSFMSPEAGALATTQIIETPNKIVVIDAQFTRKYAKQARRYIDGLKKPIDRVIVSHSHPDHWFGLEFFTDAPIYALKEVRDEISLAGDKMIQAKRAKMGDLVTDGNVAVTHLIEEGSEKIDGLTFEYRKVRDAEAGVQLLIRLPEVKTLVAQDLIYNNAHLFIGQNALDNWKRELEKISAMSGYSTLLVGHGEPAPMSIVEDMVQYLDDARTAIPMCKNSRELKKKLVEKYPGRRADFLIDISGQYLYR